MARGAVQESGCRNRGAGPRGVVALCIRARVLWAVALPLVIAVLVSPTGTARGEDLRLEDLVSEALKNNHDILMSDSKAAASRYRIPQAKSLPDPMVMFGYQNEGFRRYTYGESPDAQWMFSASQMFLFPGKRELKENMATREAESIEAFREYVRLKTIEQVRRLYYELFLTYKEIDIIRDRALLFGRVEDAALARYSSGMGQQQEVLMAQTEKYMLLEKEQMLRQRIQSLESMLNAAVGRDVNAPLGRPVERLSAPYDQTMDDLLKMHVEHSPLVKSKEKMVAAAEAKAQMARREYYPDFTVNAGYFKRGGEFEDMWSLTTTVNIPIFYKSKQRQAVNEARAALSEAVHDLAGTKIMLSSAIRDNHSMLRTAEGLMDLYKNGLIPKTYQDFESGLAGYTAGKVEAITVITRLKALLDLEMLYWVQFAEREKTIARLEAVAGALNVK